MAAREEEIIPRVRSHLNVSQLGNAQNYRPSYNVPPTRFQPVIYAARGQERDTSVYQMTCMRWGLVPFWSKDGKPITINTRDDSVDAGKPLYRHSRDSKRCVVLAEGFYEWNAEKLPFYFYPATSTTSKSTTDLNAESKPFLYLAAFRDEWKSLQTYTILTTNASRENENTKTLGQVHDRMPVILTSKAAVEEWLNPELKWGEVRHLVDDLQARIQYVDEVKFKAAGDATLLDLFIMLKRPVSTQVSSVKAEDCSNLIQHTEHPKTPLKRKQPSVLEYVKKSPSKPKNSA